MTSSSTGMNTFCDNRSLLNPLSSSMECQSYLAHWQRSNRTSLQNPLGPHKISELLTLASLWLSNSLDLNTWVSHWSPLLDFHLCLNGLKSVVACIPLAILLKDVTCCFSPLPWFVNNSKACSLLVMGSPIYYHPSPFYWTSQGLRNKYQGTQCIVTKLLINIWGWWCLCFECPPNLEF